MTTIAIMQPYFIPYAGYFRLFTTTDLFVVYDCVQFPRRGWVHRNRLLNPNGDPTWLTLNIKKTKQTTPIHNLTFAEHAQALWAEQWTSFPSLQTHEHPLKNCIKTIAGTPLDFIVKSLECVCESLSIDFNIAFSSTLDIPPEIKGQERILAIAKHFHATTYINAPGGHELYDEDIFKSHNITLKFLSPFPGNSLSILHRLLHEDDIIVRKEILDHSVFE